MIHRWFVLQAITLAICGAIIPIAAGVYFSWNIVRDADQKELADDVDRILAHTVRIFTDARETLMSAAASDFVPCSEGHVLRMRELTAQSPFVASIGFTPDRRFYACSGWGRYPGTQVPVHEVDFFRQDGIGIATEVMSRVVRNRPMIVLYLDQYGLLLNPQLLLEGPIEPEVGLVLLAENDTVVAIRNDPDMDLLEQVQHTPGSGQTSTQLYAVARSEGWTLAATQPAVGFWQHIRAQSAAIIPFSAVVALFSISVVFWYSRRRLSLRGEIAVAIRKHEFRVYYQPIIELASGRCVGAEALVRWQRPDGTNMAPDIFVPLAEETGQIMQITDQVIENVVLDLNVLLVKDRSLHIAINLSASDISSGRFLPVLTTALSHTGIRPKQIVLEATERGFVDFDGACRTLNEARNLGYDTAIDDFGTGYSSLQYLRTLPVATLKIDKSFVDTICTDSATSAVTSHIIDMAKELNLLIVAEGVETQQQADYLNERGVEFAQGWLFSRPLAPAAFIAFCEERRRRFGSAPEPRHSRQMPEPNTKRTDI